MTSDDEGGNFLSRGKKFLSKAKFSNDSKSPRATFDSPAASAASADEVPDAEQSAYQRRRAQVRRAQRSHRERKQNYVRELEQQVETLRKYYSPKVESFESEIAFLRQYILAHGLEIPTRPDPNQPLQQQQQPGDFQLQNPVDVSFGGFGDPGSMLKVQMPNVMQPVMANGGAPAWGDWPAAQQQQLQAQQQQQQQQQQLQRQSLVDPTTGLPVQQGNTPFGSVAAPAAMGQQAPNVGGGPMLSAAGQPIYHTDQTFKHSSSQPQSPMAAVPSPAVKSAQAAQALVVQSSTLAQFAMDFILTLEHVCTAHLLADPSKGGSCQASDGHAMCASTQLFAMAHPPINFNASESQWKVPASAIDNLLALSSSLDMDNKEITPVQAWHRLRSHPAFSRASLQQLQQLTINLDKETKCEGFGAVIDTEFFEWSLNHYLGKGLNA